MEIGFDISHHNGRFDFQAAQSLGNKFCWLKATQGTTFVDPQFHRSSVQAPASGILTGAYHFFEPGQDPSLQAKHFIDVAGPFHAGLPPMFDWEISGGARISVQKSGAKKWLDMVEGACGKRPIIYTYPSFAEGLGDLSEFADYPLWIAHYHVPSPRIPKPWTKFLIWQNSDDHGYDKDLFNGSIEELRALAN